MNKGDAFRLGSAHPGYTKNYNLTRKQPGFYDGKWGGGHLKDKGKRR